MTSLHNLFQDLRISKNSVQGDQSKVRTYQNEAHTQTLSEKIDQLYLMNLAALELLNDLGVSQSQIMAKIEEIDLRDGKLDDKVAQATHCSDCGHRISARRTHCFYCGSKINNLQYQPR
ncbi:zinc ribbon domain-containing protein [Pseudoalteromonas sp. YIC-656]|uniref:zinc ribbon domain-containing protein n=1 Tax=Pseudoalteromonas pernae TaxID=3118054 RepID=UPI0032426715